MSYKCEHGKDSDICVKCWEESNLESRIETMNPQNNTQLKSAEELMKEINRLTPDIKGRAFDPDWFLLRQKIELELLNAYKAGMTEAAKLLEQRSIDYDQEHGNTDMETGTRYYPKGGDDYMLTLTELAEDIITARDKKEIL